MATGITIKNLLELTDPTSTDLLTVVSSVGGPAASMKMPMFTLVSSFMLTGAVVQTFAGSSQGTYTPTTNMKKCFIICVGGGGGGEGGVNTDSSGGGGGGGGTAMKLFHAGSIGAYQQYTVGGGGAAGVAGGTTRIGSITVELLQAGGGGAGLAGSTTTGVGCYQSAGGPAGVGSQGDLNIAGQPGGRAIQYSGANGSGGFGGCSMFGAGGRMSGTGTDGQPGLAYGGGGGGGHAATAADHVGGIGADGMIFILEFIG